MKGRIYGGSLVLLVGFLTPLLIPLVLATELSATIKSVVSGLLAFGVPELFMIIAVGIMGKEGFNYLKRYLSLVMRRYGPPDEVGPLRYTIGIIMFTLPLLLSIFIPYFGYKISFFSDSELVIMIILHIMLLLSLFVLGGDFWDKLRGLFIRRAKIDFSIRK